VIIRQINSFIAATFKAQNKEELDPNIISKLGRNLGITLT